jgi:uncharacterized protein
MWSGRITSLVVWVCCVAFAAPHAGAQDRRFTRSDLTGRRLALVVGNDTYPTVPLVNAVNDAKAVDGALRTIGFTTALVTNAPLEAMDRAVEAFVARIQPGDVALFYYSGHGVQLDGENYLLSVDFSGTDPIALKRRTTSVSELHDRLQARGARVRILLLDACRDNPFRGSRSGTQGLAAMQAEGALIAFATAAGSTASDNAGGANGVFTTHFLEALATPGLEITELFKRVKAAVREASDGRQVPWVSASLEGDFWLRPPTTGAPSELAREAIAPDADIARREEVAFWESIKDSALPPELASLLERCNGAVAPDCTKLGHAYEMGASVLRDASRAAQLHRQGCDGGHARGCSALGWLYQTGEGVSQDVARAAVLYGLGCDGGDPLACWNLGSLHERGTGVPKDVARAAALYRQSYRQGCDLGEAEACWRLGRSYEDGPEGLPRDRARALQLFDSACGRGTKRACEDATRVRQLK